MKKLTIFGDIMCEPRLLQQGQTPSGFDFTSTFAHLKTLIREAEYVIANLESPIAGEGMGYTDSLVSFNAPLEFATAVKEAGIDVVSTANNHALDRGVAGLFATLESLDQIGLAHTGACRVNTPAEERIHYFQLGDTTVALIAYTTSTNYVLNKTALAEKEKHCINYLRPVDAWPMGPPLPSEFLEMITFIERVGERPMSWEEKTQLKREMGVPIAYSDDYFDPLESQEMLDQLAKEYRMAKEAGADLVLFYPHTGGQFNIHSGSFSNYIVEEAVAIGFDAVIAAHSHTTQRAQFVQGVPCFYSLGNLTMTPASFYAISETLPEYGIAAHLYIKDGAVKKTTFSILKIIDEREDLPLTVYPVDELLPLLNKKEAADLLRDVSIIYERITALPLKEPVIRREYPLTEKSIHQRRL